MPDSVTQLRKAGPVGTKLNIAVLGDGFAEADQSQYNQLVDDLLIKGVFGHDYFYEDDQAFNIFRVNLISKDSGVSQVRYDEHGTFSDGSDDTVLSRVNRDTALGYIFSGSWAHCWLEGGPNTGAKVASALSTWVPDYDLVVVILNEPSYGGCGGGGFQVVPSGVNWEVMAHEFGHGTGGLADEYSGGRGAYTGGEPGGVNVTSQTDRTKLKWRKFLASSTPIPTGTGPGANYNVGARPAGWSGSQDVGLFEGGSTFETSIYRPVENCRMKGNSPPFCPVCYTALKTKMATYTGRTFRKVYVGDFNGDGKQDVLIHNDNSIQIFRSNGAQLDLVFSAVERVPGSWQFKPHDQLFIGDFNGDGKDEVVVYNSVDWAKEYLGLLVDDGNNGLRLIARYDDSMPGWTFSKDDRFVVADFDGDGKKDLYVFNGTGWAMPYLGMLRSSGTGFSLVRRYDGSLPGWAMRPNDQLLVGRFTGSSREDLVLYNGSDWSMAYLGLFGSTGSALGFVARHDGSIPGWAFRKGDRLYAADFDGDGRTDLYVFNGTDWAMSYLGMLRATGTGFALRHRYDANAPGWQMRKGDRHFVSDVEGTGRQGLFVYNCTDWSKEYLGTMISSGSALSCAWKEDWVGEWNLGSVDAFEVCNYEGAAGRRDLVVHNDNWLGLIRATPTLSLQKIYYRWIHNYRAGRNW